MSGSEHAPGYVSNADYSQDDWDDVSDSPELTDEQIAQMQPGAAAMPELSQAMRRHRAPQTAPSQMLLSLRIDRDVVEAYRTSGPGWQFRINEALRKAVGL